MPHSKTHTTRLTPNSAPAQLGEEQDDRLHPVQVEQLHAHAAHLREEVPEEPHHLAVEPVDEGVQDRGCRKVYDKDSASPIFRFKPFRGRFQKVHIPILKLLSGRSGIRCLLHRSVTAIFHGIRLDLLQ